MPPMIGRKSKVTILEASGKCLFKEFKQASHRGLRSQYSTSFNDGDETVKVDPIESHPVESFSQVFPVDAFSEASFSIDCTASSVLLRLEFASIYKKFMFDNLTGSKKSNLLV